MRVRANNASGGGGGNFVEGDILASDWNGTSISSTVKVTLGFKPKTLHWWSSKSGISLANRLEWCYSEDGSQNNFTGTQGAGVATSYLGVGTTTYYGNLKSVDIDGFTLVRYGAEPCYSIHYIAQKP